MAGYALRNGLVLASAYYKLSLQATIYWDGNEEQKDILCMKDVNSADRVVQV